jgi:hypothetical protein
MANHLCPINPSYSSVILAHVLVEQERHRRFSTADGTESTDAYFGLAGDWERFLWADALL